jgi:hypothetical protein
MRLQKQASEVGGQADQGPRVLVEPIHPSAGARVYDIPITIRGYVERWRRRRPALRCIEGRYDRLGALVCPG